MLINNMLLRVSDKKLLQIFCFSIMVLVSLAHVFRFIEDLSRGIDLTDESFYLVYSTFPDSILASVTSFGYYTKIILDLANGDIYWFRVTGFLILLGTSFFFSCELNKYITVKTSLDNRLLEVSWIVVSTMSLFSYYSTWVVTPSYNLIVLLSCLTISGSCLAIFVNKLKGNKIKQSQFTFQDFLYFFLIAVSLHFCFLTKAPSCTFTNAFSICGFL